MIHTIDLLRTANTHLTDISNSLSTSIDVKVPDEIDVNVTNVSVPVSGTVAVTNDGLTDLAAAINNSKIDVNLKSNEVVSFPVTGTVAVTNASIDDIKTNTNVLYTSYSQQAVPVANTNALYTCNLLMNSSAPYAMANPATNSGNKDGYCQRVCIATDDINIKKLSDCVTGTNLNVGTHAVTVSSGSVNATCSGTVAITNATLDTIDNQINSSGLVVTGSVTATQSGTYNVNLTQANTNAIPVSTGVKTNGTIRVCVADDDTNLKKLSDCVTGTNLNVGTHAVTVSSGSINATCSGTVAVTNSDISSMNSRQSRQSGGSLESLSVAEYKLIYKSSYAADASVFTKYYESFHSNCQFQDSDGGINIFPVSAPGYWIYGTRFHFLNGNNTWLVIYPGLVGNSSSATPSLEVGVFYWDTNGYISIINDYTAAARPTLKYVLHDINQSAGIAMSSWNVDVFDGTGASGLNLNSDTFKTYAWSWFIMLGAQTNYAYIGLVSAGKLWVGHQFSLQNSAAITSNTAKTNNIGFKPYIRNNNTTASKSVYCGGFEIYSKLGNYLNCSIVPYNFYNSYTVNASTTVYPFAIFQQAASLASSYINLRYVSCKTIGTSDVGDFRVEIWHTIDSSYTITGGTVVNNLGSAYIHGATSISDANAVKIATLLPNSDNCISRDISWIDHKHFGFHVQGLGGYTSIVYFLIINMSASVNKTAYFSIEWSE